MALEKVLSNILEDTYTIEFPMKIITTNTIKKIETITIDDSSPDLPATQEEETNIEKIPAKVVVESNIKYTKDVILIDDGNAH